MKKVGIQKEGAYKKRLGVQKKAGCTKKVMAYEKKVGLVTNERTKKGMGYKKKVEIGRAHV